MVTKGLIVRLEAKAGREDDVVAFLRGAVPLVEAEQQTVAWLAVRIGASSFAIVDVFPDAAGRNAHLAGPVASALLERAGELLSAEPEIQHVDVLAAKLPGAGRAHDQEDA
jgi:quinol monooxygenase YgiN